jgi:hypothetical protein
MTVGAHQYGECSSLEEEGVTKSSDVRCRERGGLMSTQTPVLKTIVSQFRPLVSTWVESNVHQSTAEHLTEDAVQLAKLLDYSVPDEEQKDFRNWVQNALRTPPQSEVMKVRIQVLAEGLVSAWSEVLRWASKAEGDLWLDGALMPEDFGRAERAWQRTLEGLRIQERDVRVLFTDFAQSREVAIVLPWGGVVSSVGDRARLLRAPARFCLCRCGAGFRVHRAL